MCDDINPEFEIFDGEEEQSAVEYIEQLDNEDEIEQKKQNIRLLPAEIQIFFLRNIEHLITRIRIDMNSRYDLKHFKRFLEMNSYNFFIVEPNEFHIDVNTEDLFDIFKYLKPSSSTEKWGYDVNLFPVFTKVCVYN
jgi:hypothetical protein